MNRGRVREERGSKETDGCPLTLFQSLPGCKGNLTVLRRILHLDLAKGNPK
jgi:hypothetical protein